MEGRLNSGAVVAATGQRYCGSNGAAILWQQRDSDTAVSTVCSGMIIRGQHMVYGGKRWEKVFVEVIARHALDGRIEPLTIIWADGRRFEIERIRQTKRGACLRTKGHAIRYDVEINRRVKHLYRDDQGWFVETIDDLDFTRDPRLWDPPA